MREKIRSSFIIFFSLMLLGGIMAGCSAIQSQRVDPVSHPYFDSNSSEGDSDREGLAYFLPLGRIHISATRNDVLVTNYWTETVMDGKGTNMVLQYRYMTNTVSQIGYSTNLATPLYAPILLSTSNGSYSTNFSMASVQTNVVDKNGKTNVILVPLFTNSSTQTSSSIGLLSSNLVSVIQTNSFYTNTTITTITTSQPLVTTNYTYTMTISNDYRADRSKMFLLHPQMDPFHDDLANITIDNNGFLSSINVSNADQTGAVIVQLAQAAEQAFQLVASGGTSAVGGGLADKLKEAQTQSLMGNDVTDEIQNIIDELTKPKLIPPQFIDISFDPFNAKELKDATNTLSQAGITIENEDIFEGKTQFNDYPSWQLEPKEADGIYYRPPMPFEVRLRDTASNVVSRTVLLPNRSPILHLNLKKNAFVARISSVTLTNGFISSYAFTKPSSALAIAALPVTLISGVTSSLTNLIQLKINLATGQNNLATTALTQQQNQITALNNTMNLLIAQQKLLAAQTNSPAH